MLSEYPFLGFDIFQLFRPDIVLFINRYKEKREYFGENAFLIMFLTQGGSLGSQSLIYFPVRFIMLQGIKKKSLTKERTS